MRNMPAIKRTPSGFTLVEMLIIAPIVILFIGGFVGLLVAMTGDSLKRHAQNIMTYETQAALEDIETSTAKASSFLTTTGTLQDKQGKGDTGGTAFTNTTSGAPDTLIFASPATTKNPYDSTRSLVYTGSGTCDSAQPVYTYTSVYFIDSGGTLYKRTILPTSSTPCTTPYQQGSCSAAVMASAPPSYCKVEDNKLLENVSGFSVQYFDSDGNSSTATTATSANVTIQTNRSVAGQALSYSGTARSTKQNTTTSSSSAIGSNAVTFAYTGASQTWQVPAGISLVQVEVWGAEGATSFSGKGGYAKGNLTVTPGQTLYIYVGQAGSIAACCGMQLTSNPFNGGGRGTTYNAVEGGGSGGGASDVRTTTSLSNRVIVAGGGGGGYIYSGAGNPAGGNGGGVTGNNGVDYPGYPNSAGKGGTQSAGGGGGYLSTGASAGVLGQGGNSPATNYGGGGGGGYYGGGGGDNTAGGGGSSYTGGVASGTTTAGLRSGNGQVVITY